MSSSLVFLGVPHLEVNPQPNHQTDQSAEDPNSQFHWDVRHHMLGECVTGFVVEYRWHFDRKESTDR